ncbi:MAG: hypothetical protein NC340_04830 [Ruminococcus flavefaciens]|nr:hypothetical protein [Ruminococcus flavefaciens]MCM1229011.1 hypothetical protein [Ruminococcus flavefaciens]
MGNYVDPGTFAENAGNVGLSAEKFIQVLYGIIKVPFLVKATYNSNFERINDYMMNGDTQPAVVYSVKPLIISAYSDEMDGVVFLEFPEQFAEKYNLYEGMRLVTSNVYQYGKRPVKDINAGAGYLKRYSDFTPIVQLFLTDSENYARRRTMLFGEEVWDRVNLLTEEYARSGKKPRRGFYYLTAVSPAVMFGIICIIAGIGIAMLYN